MEAIDFKEVMTLSKSRKPVAKDTKPRKKRAKLSVETIRRRIAAGKHVKIEDLPVTHWGYSADLPSIVNLSPIKKASNHFYVVTLDELEKSRTLPNLPGSEVKKADESSEELPARPSTGKMKRIKQKGEAKPDVKEESDGKEESGKEESKDGIKKEEKQPETRQDTQQKPNGSSDVQPGDSIKVGQEPVKVSAVGKDGVTATDDKGDKHLIRHENVEPHEGEAKSDGKEDESKDNSFKKPEEKNHPVIDEFKSIHEGQGKGIDKTWMVHDPKVDGVYMIFTHEKGIKDSPYKAHIFYRKDKDIETIDDVSSAIKKYGPESLKAEFDKKSGNGEKKEEKSKVPAFLGKKEEKSKDKKKEKPKTNKTKSRKEVAVDEDEEKSMREYYVIDVEKAQIKPYTRTRRGKHRR